MREAVHERVKCHKYPGNGRTKSREQKYPQYSRENGVRLQRLPARARESDDGGKQQMGSQYRSQEQKPDRRGATCKWREKSTHLQIRLRKEVQSGKPKNIRIRHSNWGCSRRLLRGPLYLDDSALQSDHGCVGSVFSAQFGQNVANVPINGFEAQ